MTNTASAPALSISIVTSYPGWENVVVSSQHRERDHLAAIISSPGGRFSVMSRDGGAWMVGSFETRDEALLRAGAHVADVVSRD